MIKAVLFDLDGTLLNRDESLKCFINNQYERLSKWIGHIPKDQYTERFIELDNRGYVWKDKVYQQLTREFHISNLTWEELLDDYIGKFRYNCVPFDHLIQTLDALKSSGIHLGMITNGYGHFQMENIKALGIDSYLDIILISEWEGIKKPDPDIFKKALSRLHVLPEQSIFVGDHPINDVQAAKSIGMKGIWKRDPQWEKVAADYTIGNLNELPFVIKELMSRDAE